jgi:hypothetical protein
VVLLKHAEQSGFLKTSYGTEFVRIDTDSICAQKGARENHLEQLLEGWVMKFKMLLAGLLAVSAVGCSSGSYTQRSVQEEAALDTLLPPPLSVNDIVAMVKDSVGDDVIMDQIKASESYFRLTKNEIIRLKKDGVSDKVISAMINTKDDGNATRRVYAASYPVYYPDYGYFWYPYYYYWRPAIRVGFTHIGQRYGGFGFGAHRPIRVRR